MRCGIEGWGLGFDFLLWVGYLLLGLAKVLGVFFEFGYWVGGLGWNVCLLVLSLLMGGFWCKAQCWVTSSFLPLFGIPRTQ